MQMRQLVQQWVAGEVGLVLAFGGFLMFVFEWLQVFTTQGNALALEDLRIYVREWLIAKDDSHGTALAHRGGWIARMINTLPEITDETLREMFRGYILDLSPRTGDATQAEQVADAFYAEIGLAEKAGRPHRKRKVALGVLLVLLGTVGQMISGASGPIGPVCANAGTTWRCPPG